MELHDLATGPVSPLVAMIFAMLGSLLGVLLVTLARRRTGLRRVRLVLYAAVAVALPAIWLPAVIAILALRVDGSVLRLSPEPLGISLGVAAGATLLALVPICFGRPGPVRQAIAGILLAGAIGGTGVYAGATLTTGGPIVADATRIGVAVAIACVTGFGLASALAATRTLHLAVATATLLGLAFAGIYHIAAAALRVQPAPGGPIRADDVVGLAPQRIGLPTVIGAAVIVALLWYFTLGSATVRDLRLIFDPNSDAEQIEPWMIEQVRTRVALSSTAYAPIPGLPEIWARNEPTVAVHAVPIGRGLADAFSRPWPGRSRPETTAEGIIDEPKTIDAVATPVDADSETSQPAVADLTEALAPTGPRAADGSEPAGTTGTTWRGVPAWGLPTSPWSRAELDDALGLAGNEDGPEGDWPSPGRNEPGVAHRGRPSPWNSRFGAMPDPAQRPVSPAPDLAVPTDDEDFEWPDRIRTAVSRAAASRPAVQSQDSVIVTISEPGAAPLPRRNARPIDRP